MFRRTRGAIMNRTQGPSLFVGLGFTLAVVGVLLLSGLLPLAIVAASDGRVSWSDLANIGQAYGTVSALLSAFALIGVVGSLVLQRRQMQATRQYETKKMHLDLVRMAVENPLLLSVEGDVDPDGQVKAYANLLVSHWALAWDVRAMTGRSVRANAARLFNQQVVRDWWRDFGNSYATSAERRGFVKIMDEEYVRAAPNCPL
jgi:hypothetical protein